MKCLLINLIVFVTFVNSDIGKRLSLPQLPFGIYRLNFLGVTRCDSSIPTNNKLKYELYLSKKSANTTEIKGVVTNSVPLDDSLDLEFKLAVKDSIGGWKENAFIYKTPKACSSLKKILGPAWNPVLDSAGAYNATCPIAVTFYNIRYINN
uniref:MD-2-related lipid-recognition domain-containing protein n=1 Tax=Schizaphis graminum TaxID=13262 RepID=A0A2S2PQ48_SCHGA